MQTENIEALKLLIDEIRLNATETTAKLDDGISVNNLDEIEAALHNELSKNVKVLVKAIGQLKDIKTEKVSVSNLSEIKFPKFPEIPKIEIPDSVKVNNFSELQGSLDSLSAAIQNIPAPEVFVNPPEIRIPETKFPEIDLSPVIRAIELNLNKLRTNDKGRPLAVRLSDGTNFINQLQQIVTQQKEAFAAFSGEGYVKLADGSRFTGQVQTTETFRQQFVDYDVRTDGQPVYIGYAPRGTAQGSNGWTIEKCTYTTIGGSDYLASKQIAYDTWSNRASASYA